MKTGTIGRPIVLIVALGFLAPLRASAEDTKIGFFDSRRAISSSKAGKTAEKTLTGLMETKREELRPREEQLRKLKDEFDAQRFVLSKDALQEKEMELVKMRNDLERDMAAAQEELQIEERKLMEPLLRNVRKAVSDLGSDKGFTVILERESPFVLYYDDDLDVTDLVIQRLNEGG